MSVNRSNTLTEEKAGQNFIILLFQVQGRRVVQRGHSALQGLEKMFWGLLLCQIFIAVSGYILFVLQVVTDR